MTKYLLIISLLTSSLAHAYFSTMDTGEILPTGKYRLLGELQYYGEPKGLNLGAAFDTGVSESSNLRVVAGAGSVNFHTGLFYKWVPFPDTESQPAVGIMAGGTWARYEGDNYPSLRAHPIVSKKFETDFGAMIPYVSLPFGITAGPGKNTFPFQFAAGSEWYPVGWESMSLMAELGVNINDAANYISAAFVYHFAD